MKCWLTGEKIHGHPGPGRGPDYPGGSDISFDTEIMHGQQNLLWMADRHYLHPGWMRLGINVDILISWSVRKGERSLVKTTQSSLDNTVLFCRESQMLFTTDIWDKVAPTAWFIASTSTTRVWFIWRREDIKQSIVIWWAMNGVVQEIDWITW